MDLSRLVAAAWALDKLRSLVSPSCLSESPLERWVKMTEGGAGTWCGGHASGDICQDMETGPCPPREALG